MPYFLVSDFRGGLDVRKSPWTAEAGTLQEFTDGHVTRGGEIEKRKEFTDVGDLLAATYSLVAARAGSSARGLVVFGSAAAPSLPAGVTYQRLQHPDGIAAMTGVAAMTLFDGKPYVVADFDDGSQFHYYDGALVTDWGAGIVRASMTTNDLIAEHMRSLIDADASYSATRVGPTFTVVGPIGTEYTVVSETANVTGGVNDQTITYAELEAPIPAVAEAVAFAEFSILEGSVGAGNYIDKVRVDITGVFTDLISATVPYNTTPELTALDVAVAINAGTGTHGYFATTRYGKVYVFAQVGAGASANGRVIEVTAKGNVILYDGRFAITGGSSGASNELIMVKVNGANAMSAAVAWATSDSATAASVASNIVAFASSPKMNARAVGSTVFISPEKIRSDDATSYTVNVSTGGDVTAGSGDTPPVVDQYPDYNDPYDPTQDYNNEQF